MCNVIDGAGGFLSGLEATYIVNTKHKNSLAAIDEDGHLEINSYAPGQVVPTNGGGTSVMIVSSVISPQSY